MKKGISVIFQYLLVAIVGVMILFFFIRFAWHSAETFESMNSAYVASALRDSFTGLSVSGHSSTMFPERGWPDDVDFKMGEGDNCGRIAVDNSNFIPVSEIIYGPSTLRGKYFNVWTRVWKYPYKITNFFYLTNKNTKYFLVYDGDDFDTKLFANEIDSFASEIDPIEHIPRNFNVRAIGKSNAMGDFVANHANTNDFVKLVFFNTDPDPNIISRDNVEIVRLDYSNCNSESDCIGKVYFGNEERDFYGKAMMYGAIFAGSLENYDCNYKRAMKAFDVVNDVYGNKADLLRAKTGCDYSVLNNNINNVHMESFADNMMGANQGDGGCKSVF